MAEPRAKAKRHPLNAAAWALTGLAIIVVALAIAIRILPATDGGRAFVESRLEGIKVGRLGHLHLSGVGGDLWGRFTVASLSIDDGAGPWLVARDVRVTWRPADLLRAQVHVATLGVGHITVVRRFTLTRAGPPKPSPVAIKIDHADGVLETLPAFSINRGLFAVGVQLLVKRSGAPTGAAAVCSLLHPGDRLDADFNFGRKGAFDLKVAAREARGGALAGALGLATNRDFALNLSAHAKRRVGGFDLVALSGEARAADATGRWTEAGGEAHGRISLAASTLLAPYQALIGPEVRFETRSRAVTKALYALDLAAGGDKAAVTATGVIDPAHRTTGARGVKLALRIDTPTLLIKTGASGPLRLNGGLGATADHWVFDGAAELRKPVFDGLSYTRVSGPLRVEGIGKQIGVRTTLHGEGGVGGGLAAGLLGAAPTIAIDASMLGDGRAILRKVSLEGADLKVSGEGRVGLLNDLSFTGQAAVANLARAKLGAHGGVSGSWSAKQSGRSPWVFGVDTKGVGFSLGVEQVDHLLGPAPTLKAKGAIDGAVINLEQVAVAGRSGAITAAGKIGAGGSLKIATTWRATGPLPIGPIEIDGAAKGTGDISGTLASPTADLIADLPKLDLPTLPLREAHLVARLQSAAGNVSGRVSLAAASEYGPARAQAAFALSGGGIQIGGLDADAGGLKISGGFALKDATPSSADLVFSAGPGAFLDAGHAAGHARIIDAAGGPRAEIAVSATETQMRGGPLFHTLKVTADGPLRHLAYHADVAGLSDGTPFRLAGTGVYSQAAAAGADNAFSFEGAGRVRGVDVRTTAPAHLTFAGNRYGAALSLGVGGGHVVAQVNGVGPESRRTRDPVRSVAGRLRSRLHRSDQRRPHRPGFGSDARRNAQRAHRQRRAQGPKGRLATRRRRHGDPGWLQPAHRHGPDFRQGLGRADQCLPASRSLVVAVPHRHRAAAADDRRLRHRRRTGAVVGPDHG